MVKHLLRYLKGTINTTIKYEWPVGHIDLSRLVLIAYCDADHASDVATCKSISAYLFQLASGPILWSSSFQKVVSLSLTKAEYVALTHTCKQAVFSHKILGLELDVTTPMTIYCDSQSAIVIANSAQHDNQPCLKHFDVKIHFIQEMVAANVVRVIYRSTDNMLADYLTKSLAQPTFERLTMASRLINHQRHSLST